MTEAELRRVLVVDDDAALVRMVRLHLLQDGYDVLMAHDGIQGLEVLETSSVNVIVLDLQMPQMDGREFFRAIRSKGISTPVLVLSAYGAEAAMKELGAEAGMAKPFDPDILLSTLRDLVRSADPTQKVSVSGS